MKDSNEEKAEVCFSRSAGLHRWALKLVDGEGLGGETLAVSKGKVCDSIYN